MRYASGNIRRFAYATQNICNDLPAQLCFFLRLFQYSVPALKTHLSPPLGFFQNSVCIVNRLSIVFLSPLPVPSDIFTPS